MKTIRVCIPTGDGSFSILEIPERSVVMSLVNDSKRTPYDSVKTFVVDHAWANGDGVELTARRVPVLTCDACGISLQGIRPGPDSPGGRFVLYDRTCIASVLGLEPCHVGRKETIAELEEKGLEAAISAQERSKAATRKILEELDAEDEGLKAALWEIKRELCEAHAMLGGTDQETLKQAVERVLLARS